MCKRIFKEQTTTTGEIPFYKIGTFGGEPDAFISRELFEDYKAKFSYPEVGDMLISASGTIGRTVEYTGKDEYFQDSNIVWFKHDDRIDNSFLRCLYSIVEWSGIEGSTIKRLYNDNFLKTEFMLPCVAEQRKVGSFFSHLDNLITLHQREYFLFDFSGGSAKIAQNTLSWEQRELGDICEYHSSSLTAKDVYEDGSYDLYDANSLIGKTNKGCMEKDYITIIKDGAGVGRTRLLPKNSMFLGTMGALTPRNSDLDFLYQLITKADLGKTYTGSTIPHIYFKDYGKNIYCIPSCTEQQQIGTYFRNLDNLITLHQHKPNKKDTTL